MAHICRHSGCNDECDCNYSQVPASGKTQCNGCTACQMMIETDKETRAAGERAEPRYYHLAA